MEETVMALLTMYGIDSVKLWLERFQPTFHK